MATTGLFTLALQGAMTWDVPVGSTMPHLALRLFQNWGLIVGPAFGGVEGIVSLCSVDDWRTGLAGPGAAGELGSGACCPEGASVLTEGSQAPRRARRMVK